MKTDKQKAKCNCDELSKNKELCPIHDSKIISQIEEKFKKIFK